VAVKIFCSHIEGLTTVSDFLSTESDNEGNDPGDDTVSVKAKSP
jgi:hypothetical protein